MKPDKNTRTKKKSSSIQSVPKTVNGILQSLNSQLNLLTPHVDQITGNLQHLGRLWSNIKPPRQVEIISLLASFLSNKSGVIAKAVFDFLKDQILNINNPWVIINALFQARDKQLVNESFHLILELVENGNLVVREKDILSLAKQNDIRVDNENIHLYKSLLNQLPDCGERTLRKMYLDNDQLLSKPAATILDLSGETVSDDLIKMVLGINHQKILAPYLKFTCASYADLNCFKKSKERSRVVESIKAIEKICGAATLREIIAKIGWSRLNEGLEIKPFAEVTIANSLPYFVPPHQANLFETYDDYRQTDPGYLVTAQSGGSERVSMTQNEEDPVKRYRAYNLRHAEVLSQILDVAPLTLDKATVILEKMKLIVQDHIILFSKYSDECSILPAVFQNITDKISGEIRISQGHEELSIELTRLIQMFEDPESLGKVQTLHGLKRYLHQQGLRLGFQLVSGSQAAQRNVYLLLVVNGRPMIGIDNISYTDFEPDEAESIIPLAVRIVIQSYFRQLLYGQENFPHVKIFCYGNEVQYYITFRNHPAFLRIDYAPPFLGGMIDLEFYGISNYELDMHPNISLNYIRRIFEFLDFDFQVDGTRIHARYDKERASDLGKLYEKAEEVFCLVPYLMDIDWAIGSLKLMSEAKDKVAEAWGDYIANWGCIPVNQLFNHNRTAIITEDAESPAGKETYWSGKGKYKDRFFYPRTENFYQVINTQLAKRGLADLQVKVKSEKRLPGQLELERDLFRKLERQIECGLIKTKKDKFEKTDSTTIEPVHEACFFAVFLSEKDEILLSAMNLGCIIKAHEKILSFTTTGTINSYTVQRARLSLCTHEILIFVLRDDVEDIRLAVYTEDDLLFYHRLSGGKKKYFNGKISSSSYLQLLRRHHYVLAFDTAQTQTTLPVLSQFKNSIQKINKMHGAIPLTSEKIVPGLKASPGRATGRVLFYSKDRPPGDYASRILISPAVRPEDNPYLFQSAGIVSTGGGILSHAGLTAIQFKKPALIVQGRWEYDKNRPGVYLLTTDFNTEKKIINSYEVATYKNVRTKEILVKEGDLVILDVKQGHLRIIGQEPDTLILYEELKEIEKTGMKLTMAKREKDILALRGRRLRARYQLEKVLQRLNQPIAASFAVEEILLGPAFALHEGKSDEQSHVLGILTQNGTVGKMVRDYIFSLAENMKHHLDQLLHKAQVVYPTAPTLCDILCLRSEIGGQLLNLKNLSAVLNKCKFLVTDENISGKFSQGIDSMACRRVIEIQKRLYSYLGDITEKKRDTSHLRHILRQIERTHLLLNEVNSINENVKLSSDQLDKEDRTCLQTLNFKNVVEPGDCGMEAFLSIGWKAANLAEVNRLMGDQLIPPWFVVTDRAFQKVLNLSVSYRSVEGEEEKSTLRNVIRNILDRDDLSFSQKSNQIFNLWEHIKLPPEIKKDVLSAYQQMESVHKKNDPDGPFFVAIRSSSREEDAENAARAGEFATYLYINGESALIQYLKRTWSGLWTERAIHNRAVYQSDMEETGGGVIVQKIICSRVSGVLQTVNVGRGEMQEMVINAGLGLGEGVVSGTVGTDQIIIRKHDEPEKHPLKVNYITSDKQDQVVFNQKIGIGTIRSKTLYHQRLRPALEYAEIVELVYLASRLERIYGYPLDIEFGIEHTRLWILQVRPVAIFTSMMEENIKIYPFKKLN